jgi:hypothetical protein
MPDRARRVGNVCAVPAAHSQCAGNFYVGSVVLDWRFLPKWDAYIGTMCSAATGGIANAILPATTLQPRAASASGSREAKPPFKFRAKEQVSPAQMINAGAANSRRLHASTF